ncbi:uncharacterized protein LOC129962991 [Argiope bruennichi]|uniref:uncharacterized protein LOC129962991 n=1 Tax=Argiope bruennichi TaxID=94029 RepID=UPI002495A1FF|nr:uncharacterized protein LOC129962991 [Argiope bruennichi]
MAPSLITVCSIYLSPNVSIDQKDINSLLNELPHPLILVGDFNGHSPLWGSERVNFRGKQIVELIDSHSLCLLNNGEQTYFHKQNRTFQSLDLAICTPSLAPKFNFRVGNDLLESDHFPIFLEPLYSNSSLMQRPPRYLFSKANWALFSVMANITKTMVTAENINDAVSLVTDTLIAAADFAIPKSADCFPKYRKPWWNQECTKARQSEKRAWNKFRRQPTTRNLILYSEAKSKARLVRRRSQKSCWLQHALSNEKETAPGPDGVTYGILKHLSHDALVNILYMFNRIWREHVFPIQWNNAIVIPILKPNKDPQNLINYRPIALTCCLCKLLEKMVNARLIHVLETKEFISSFQSGFRKRRSTVDNLIALETDIRNAFHTDYLESDWGILYRKPIAKKKECRRAAY